jgi:hypothetical protein
MRRFGNVLFWFGATVLIVVYVLFGAIGAISSAYAASGLLGVAVALTVASAIPAIIVGTILGE